MNLLRYFQGERPGMGSELIMPTPAEERLAFYSPSVAIEQSVQLADISFYQGAIDWSKMAANLQGVIIRAGQRTWPDSKFKENWQGAKAAGLPRGSYWFYDSRETPEKQAALWWSLIKDDPGELVHAADLEESYGGLYGSSSHMRTFVAEFQRLSGLPDDRIAIYTGYYWWMDRIGGDPFFVKFWLWLAWYAAMNIVRIPPPWVSSDLLFWQYTSSGDGPLYGVSSQEIDLNWYCCDLATYQEQFHLTSPLPPPTGETMQVIQGEALVNVTIRKTPAGDATGKYLLKGDKIEADKNQYQWLHLTKINGTPVDYEAWASAGSTQQYIKWSWVEVIPEPPPPPAGPTLTHTILVYSDGSIKVDGNPV